MAISIEDVPPAYHEVVAALSKAVESDPKAAHKALADSFKKESSNILVKQSRDLTDTITTLKKLFESISLNLIRVDQVLTVGGPRRPTWDKIYEDYKVLVNETKEDAISVKSFAEKYLESVLTAAQDTDLTTDEKVKEIDSFLAEVKKHADNAKDYSQRFLDIKNRVFEFRAKLVGDFDTGKDELQDKVDKCKQDIIKLEEDLAHWEKIAKGALWFVSSGVALGGAVLGAAGQGAIFAGSATLFGCATIFTPIGLGLLVVAALGIVVSGIVGITAEIKASKISSDLAAKKRELVDLESRLKALQELGPVIERSLADMGDIGEKLTILSEVWKAFEADANDVKKLLEEARGSNEKFNPASVSTAVEMYKALSNSMGVYASLI